MIFLVQIEKITISQRSQIVNHNFHNFRTKHNFFRDYFTTLKQGSEFNGENVEMCDVVYQHDDSDTYVDNLIFQISDGSNVVEVLFPIWIVPIDDQPPQIVRNMGAEIFRGGKAMLDLEDTDIDSDGPATYRLQSYLKKGELFVKQVSGEWSVSRTFTTEQLKRNQVYYFHNQENSALSVDVEDLTFTAEDRNGNVGNSFNYTVIINPKGTIQILFQLILKNEFSKTSPKSSSKMSQQ